MGSAVNLMEMKALQRTSARTRKAAQPAALRRLARIWVERRTGLIKATDGVIRIVDGELVDGRDLKRLRAVLRQPKLLWRDKEVDGVGKPLIANLLLREGALFEQPELTPDQTLSFEHTTRFEFSPPTADWIFAGGVVADLIRLPREDRVVIRREVSALLALGLVKVDSVSNEQRNERQWLKNEFSRIRKSDDPREIVGATPIDNREQVLFIAKKKVQRCLELRDTSSNRRVQQMATQVAGAVMSAAKSLAN